MQFSYDYIAIEGCIGAGKTTLAQLLAADSGARLLLEQFSDNPFLPLFYEQPERYAFPVELFFMSDRHKQMQAHFSKPEIFQPITIADYIFTKSLLFAGQTLPPDELRLFQRLFYVLSKPLHVPDIILYIHRPLSVLTHNIRQRNRLYEQQITAEYLQQISHAYIEYFRHVEHIPVLIIDMGNRDFINDQVEFKNIQTLLSQKHPPGIQYVTFTS